MNRIAELRKQQGKTLQQVGEYIGINNNTISRYETGMRKPGIAVMKELSNLFNCPVTYLYGFTGEELKREYRLLDRRLNNMNNHTYKDIIDLFKQMSESEQDEFLKELVDDKNLCSGTK